MSDFTYIAAFPLLLDQQGGAELLVDASLSSLDNIATQCYGLVVSLTGVSTLNLTVANQSSGTPGQIAASSIVFNGVPSGSVIVQMPLQFGSGSVYIAKANLFVRNNCGQSITFRANGGGDTVTMVNGELAIISCDTVHMYKITNAGEFLDGTFEIKNSSDQTKIAKFNAGGITTGTIRTFTFPNANDTLVGNATAATLTNKSMDGNTNTFTNLGNATLINSTIGLGATTLTLGVTTSSVSSLALVNPAISQISNTGVLTLPTATDTLVARATADTLTNKSISGATNTLSAIANASLTNSAVTIGTTSIALGATAATLTGLSTPSAATDAATKAYVDALANGTRWLTAIQGTSNGSILPNSPTYSNGASGVGATLTAGSNTTLTADGYTFVLNDRILVKDQASGFQNGIYSVTQAGSGSLPWILTRATDFDTAAEMPSGTAVSVINASATDYLQGFIFTTTGTITVGTTTLTFVQFTGVADITAGTGLTKTGNTLSLTTPVAVANGGTGVATSTGTGSVVLSTSPILVTPALGTPASGVATNLTGTAAGLTAGTVTTNANLTGVITSSGNATSIASQTGTGTKFVVDTSPTLVTPVLGVASATTLNKVTFTTPATGSTLTVADGKTLTSSNTLTLAGTDSTTITFQGTDTYVGRTTTDTLTNKSISGATNTLSAIANASLTNSAVTIGSTSVSLGATAATIAGLTLTAPVLGAATATTINKVTLTTPASGSTLTIADGKTLTASNTVTFTGTDGSSVAYGTGGTLTYTANNLSVFAATTSAQLAGVISDETGSGALVFANTPTLSNSVAITGTVPQLNMTSSVANQAVFSSFTEGGSQRAWRFGANNITNGNFEIIPSTTNGGSTFTTPAMVAMGASGIIGMGYTADQGGAEKLQVNGGYFGSGDVKLSKSNPKLTFNNTATSDTMYIQGGVGGDSQLHISGGTNRGVLLEVNSGTFVAGAFFGGYFQIGSITNHSSETLQVTGNAYVSAELASKHLVGNSSTPTIAAGAGAGTSPTVAVAGNDTAMQVTVTTGTLPTGAGATIATVTYNTAFGATPHPLWSVANANAALLNGASMVSVDGASTTTFTIIAGTTGLTASTVYKWNVHTIG